MVANDWPIIVLAKRTYPRVGEHPTLKGTQSAGEPEILGLHGAWIDLHDASTQYHQHHAMLEEAISISFRHARILCQFLIPPTVCSTVEVSDLQGSLSYWTRHHSDALL